jgi:diadenosine tetraphosphatase ApaH/serine/threonine PP2A family protein phosphatase
LEDLENTFRGDVHVEERVYIAIIHKLREILETEPNVLKLDSPIIVVGNTQGQVLDLFSMFRCIRDTDHPPDQKFIFLGDYIDRGYSTFETFLYLAYLKIHRPTDVYLLRGNHDFREMNATYWLYADCMITYGNDMLWAEMYNLFALLPVAAVIDPRILAVPGGLSPSCPLISQIKWIDRFQDIGDGAIGDLTWSDPSDVGQFLPNPRGNGTMFGVNQTRNFLRNNKLGRENAQHGDPDRGFVARSRQVMHQGYQWTHPYSLVTVWSAPNSAYTENNKSAFMEVGEIGVVQFHLFDADPRSSVKPEVAMAYFA